MPADRGGVGPDRAKAVRRIEDRRSEPWYRLPWGFILKRTLRSFSTDQCTDLAAGLTYFAVLSLFPALLALVSILGIVGQSQQGIDALFGMVDELAPGMLDVLRGPIESLASSPATGWALVIGIVGAVWSASGYVGGFGRALNRVYGVEEGRTAITLRPVQLGVTLLTLVALSLLALMLIVSGPVAQWIGDLLGLGEAFQIAWSIIRWPIVVAVIIVLVAVLYAATPNIKHPRVRWLTPGSIAAIVVLGIASAGFAFYVGNFGNYDRTYGALAGVIVFLLWIWIANNALLFGAELDSEVERARELVAGIEADAVLRLPLKSDKALVKKREAAAGDILASRALRRQYRDKAAHEEAERRAREERKKKAAQSATGLNAAAGATDR
ncbi:YihY/virulence factor BrkB family protein [Leifsonia sp. F6_8S_P_1B]|uniref:YihY/virulence factor BrkB family protein n=1 Tax=Leifsonia williamsii TaxID=3035919 RepID=A0ABT8KAR5_9MICO|nr:YihY/virulence factor BrkB family protein [Leifsonia williamsii]MDN4613577.1 YihY/virulence factor BrkB family protein [Leifsonia williamsii]